MPRNISGTYTLPEATFVAGTTILSASVNNDLSDIATALTQSLATTGVSTMTGPIKAASGSVTAPSYTFGSSTGTGFYLSAADTIAWTAAGVLQATFAAAGVTWVAPQTFSGAVTFSAAVTLSAALSLTNVLSITTGTEPAVTIRNSTNDTSGHSLVRFAIGSGVGDTATISAIGDGANGVDEITFDYAGSTIFRFGVDYFYADQVAIFNADAAFASFCDITEIAAPAAPSANNVRLYAVDETGVTNYAWQDAGGVVSGLRVATTANMTTPSSLLRTVPPAQLLNHPGVAKVVGNGASAGGVTGTAFNVTGIVRNGTGDYTITMALTFTDANYIVICSAEDGSNPRIANWANKTTTTFDILITNDSGSASVDEDYTFAVFGGAIA